MSDQTLDSQLIDDTIAVVALNRPDAANALNTAMALELKAYFSQPGKARVVILTGRGRHFCAGADLKERQGMDQKAWQAQHRAFEQALAAILDCPLPVIAAVNGGAYGGGLELALACDFIYAAQTARFAFTEATLGIMPGLGGTQTLPRRVGAARAREILFSGRPFSAAQAHEWGMVNNVFPPETLLDEAMATAKIISDNAPLSVTAIKRAVNQGITLPIEEALACELSHYEPLLATKDRHEGIRAWGEKRKARFTGE